MGESESIIVSDSRETYLHPALEFHEMSDVHIGCEDNLQFMRWLKSESMKLIVTSPPYNIGKAYERKRNLDEYVAGQERVIAECVRLLHPEGSICWQVGNHIANDGEVFPLDIMLYNSFRSNGL
jgi:adenine-specific DNA-methyltransferase